MKYYEYNVEDVRIYDVWKVDGEFCFLSSATVEGKRKDLKLRFNETDCDYGWQILNEKEDEYWCVDEGEFGNKADDDIIQFVEDNVFLMPIAKRWYSNPPTLRYSEIPHFVFNEGGFLESKYEEVSNVCY